MGYDVTQVQKTLSGFDYPGSPDDLARHAEGNGGDSELVEHLRSLDKNRFDGPNAVMAERSVDPDELAALRLGLSRRARAGAGRAPSAHPARAGAGRLVELTGSVTGSRPSATPAPGAARGSW